MGKFYVVMAECGEGFITDDINDADFALTGKSEDYKPDSALAEAFRDLYEDDALSIQTIEL